MKNIIVCSDRDGTINKDRDYYLGKSPNWKSQVEFLPGVVEGIKQINAIPNSKFFIITNQSGVAIVYDPTDPDFPHLTEDRMHEVNQYIIGQLEEQGAHVDGYFACPFIDSHYEQKALDKERKLDPVFIIDNHPNTKPNPGMVKQAVKSLDLKMEDCDIWMIGDRISDVEVGVNAGGRSILVPNYKTTASDQLRARNSDPERVFTARDFAEAADRIYGSYASDI